MSIHKPSRGDGRGARTVNPSRLASLAPQDDGKSSAKSCQGAALHHRAGQRVADHVFGKARAFDQSVEIDPGLDAEFVAEKNKILRADVAGGALMAGERTAA